MENMHVILDALLADQHEAVLATIVQVEASAYRKAEAGISRLEREVLSSPHFVRG